MGQARYEGGCQCGAVRFEVEADLDQTMTCNCSRCQKLGWIVTFASSTGFQLKSGEDNLADYQFSKKTIHHLFCKTCGIQPFARGTSPKDGREILPVNVRCLDGVDPATLHPRAMDGRSF